MWLFATWLGSTRCTDSKWLFATWRGSAAPTGRIELLPGRRVALDQVRDADRLEVPRAEDAQDRGDRAGGPRVRVVEEHDRARPQPARDVRDGASRGRAGVRVA